ncbi:MAG TPA: hypothetical protein VJJ83_00720, partial [Candidatus Babeliales bacterium]|nr:hypothetical protein [Candidatus Babeliales bacterium]
ENVYYSYPLMHAYAAQLRGGEPLLLPGAAQAYDHERDAAKLGEIAKVVMFRSSAYTSYLKRQPLPTKAVVTPDTSSFRRELQRPARD